MIIQVFCSLTLLVFYSLTYCRLHKGSKYPLISQLTMMLIVSNFFSLLITPAVQRIYQFDIT